MPKQSAAGKATTAWRALLVVCAKLRFKPHDIAALLDARGCYEVELAPEFPLSIKLFRYTSKQHTRGGRWHERLERLFRSMGR